MPETLVANEIYLSLQGESTFAGLPCVFVRLTACDLRCSYCDTAYAFTEGKKANLSDIRSRIAKLAEPFQERPPRASLAQGDSEPTTTPPRRGTDKTPLLGGVGVGRFMGSESQIRLPLVELTGGEPLLQENSLPLMKSLCDEGFVVLIETSGAHDISRIDPRVHRIMDLKCPSSGEMERNLLANLKHLKNTDEVKFVIGTQEDYSWAKEQIAQHRLSSACHLLFSWVAPLTSEQQAKSLKKVPAGQTQMSRKELAERIIGDALPVRFQVQIHKVIWAPESRGV